MGILADFMSRELASFAGFNNSNPPQFILMHSCVFVSTLTLTFSTLEFPKGADEFVAFSVTKSC